jgi:transglutaminase-like putative cysteine protease
VGKATLLCSLARAAGIPARIGFATVKNHLATRQLIEHLGSDLFVCHGYTDLYLAGQWVKATPAFNSELCKHFGVPPLEFNGTADSIMQAYNSRQMPFMEYLEYTGTFSDVPVDIILREWKKTYGEARVKGWIDTLENTPEGDRPDFTTEDILA